MRLSAILFFAVFLLSSSVSLGQKNDFCEQMMRSTFKIQGPASAGSVFVMGKPVADKPDRAYYVIITAAHVLEEISTDIATLSLRIKDENGYQRIFHQIKIRNAGVPLWTKHPKLDVVAMYQPMPEKVDIPLIPITLIATDEMLDEIEIQPGDEVFVAGFPLGAESSTTGFPILRSAKIANYPITPMASNPVFLLDFDVFPGNSGGPVFMNSQNRFYKGATNIGISRMVLGIISLELRNTEQIKTMTETTMKHHKLSIAVAVHAKFVRELIESLPDPQ
ncbi:MAG: serine protease [Candidatus Riflebacteria bacterium]|nr:serine protease [Candidatus Riflebacteria bacterium]